MKNQLQYRVLTLLAIMVIVIMTLSTLYGAVSMRTQLKDELAVLAKNTGERTAESLSNAMWNMDSEAAEKLILAELRESRIHALLLFDTNGDYIVGKQRNEDNIIVDKTSDDLIYKDDFLSISVDVMYGDELIGELTIQVTTKFMLEKLRSYYIYELRKALLLTTTLMILMYLTLHKLLISPLSSLTTSANALSQGNLETTIISNGIGEVGELADALEVFKTNAIEKKELEEQQ